MKFFKIQAVMMFITVFFNVLYAQHTKGIVKSELQRPVQNVAVIYENRVISKTDNEGIFILPEQLKLPLEIQLEHPHYQTETFRFRDANQVFHLKDSVTIEELKTIVLMAPSEIKSEVIIPTNFIRSEAIDQQSPVALVNAINQTAGVYIQSGAINTNRITIRGVGSRTLYGTNKIKAYFNGIPITNGVGETALDVYDPEDLQSIEVIKGPKATLYGTNLGGTILLNSKNAKSQGLSVKNSSTVGSYGLFKSSMSSDYSDKNITLHVAYDHLEQNGYRDNSRYNKNSYFVNSSYKLNDKTQMSIVLNHTNYQAQIPSSIGRTDYLENPSKAAFTWSKAQGYEADKQNLAGVSLNHNFSETFQNTTSLFYTYTDHYEPRPFNILDEYTEGLGLRSVFTTTFVVLGQQATWDFGTELFKDDYQWKTIENLYATNNDQGSLEGELLSENEEIRKKMNLFSSLTLPIAEKLTLQFGVNYNKATYGFQDKYNFGEANKSASRNFDPIIAPNVNLSYQVNPQQQLFANVSYGFNYPSLEETLTPEGMVNPEISPEKGYNYELGTEAYFFERRWHILTSYYILDIKDLLVAQRVGDDQYIGRNAGRTVHQGLEVSTNFKFLVTDDFNISPYVNASFNWHEFKDFVNEDIDYSGKDLTGIPKVTVASGIAFNRKQLSLFLNHLYVGEMPMNDANSLYSDGYNLLNLKLKYSGQLFKKLGYKVNFGVNNVTDTTYASSILINATGFNNSEPRYYYPGNPRNYYGGVSLNYHF
ncbi:TonB-dependent receptor family protein [Gelidibacter salicanalis]|uniref:TonB-dependent receptor n=1 Tax=Gelidibacter salicanalis TaxID=291193 RepID=A0A934KS83_9FLAO|nr:TonB-dependent receptor [Gelidibacter salicanalis]MBJ7881105.1 TonB-dependent receptor [Gelidibacter salicanalis]